MLEEGAGGKYLIQHSAGSGKTNSIAWSAHFLADLHDAKNKKLFDTVLVVSDRNVIDTQLQEAIFDFERTTGVVATIKGEGGSKSGELAEALSGDKKIVVCTIQTFPFALEAVREAGGDPGQAVRGDRRRGAQLADRRGGGEAEGRCCRPRRLTELDDGGEVSTEDILAAQMAARARRQGHHLRGVHRHAEDQDDGTVRHAGPTRPAGRARQSARAVPRLLDAAGHRGGVHPRRAAELHALQAGVQAGPQRQGVRREGGRAQCGAEGDHGLGAAAPLQHQRRRSRSSSSTSARTSRRCSTARPRRWWCVGSRVEAVRWQLAIDKYIKDRGYKIGTLVAFSGEVNDTESGPDAVHRDQQDAEPEPERARHPRGVQGRRVPDPAGGEQVPDRLRSAAAVRHVRGQAAGGHPGRADAVAAEPRPSRQGHDLRARLRERPEDVLAAFKTYYTTAELDGVTDPNLVYNLRAKLDAAGHYDDFEVDRVVAVELNPKAKQSDLIAALEPVVDRLLKRYKAGTGEAAAARREGRRQGGRGGQGRAERADAVQADMGAFQRLYTFLSQIFDYGNTAIEKRSIFYKRLLPLLEFGREREGIDLSKVVLTHHNLKDQGKRPLPLGEGETPKLEPITEAGAGSVQEKEKARLDRDHREGERPVRGRPDRPGQAGLRQQRHQGQAAGVARAGQQATNNTKEQFANSPTSRRSS